MKVFKLGFVVLIAVILNACAGIAVPERSAFHQAALHGNAEQVERLLPTVTDIDAFDETGFAAIHWASTSVIGDPAKTAEVLLKAGANPNLPHKSAKMTPLFFASNAEVVNTLIDAGADIEYRAIDQSTPLHHAKSVEVIEALLARGADKSAKNISGKTPKENFESTLSFFETGGYSRTYIDDINAKIAALNGGVAPQQTGSMVNGFVQTASNKQDSQFILPDLDNLVAAQPCTMSEEAWIYTGESCLEGLAHGKGSALNKISPLRFEGLIEHGLPTEGVLYENDIEVYEGGFKEGLAHGAGICYFEGSPEECRYFKGQRIDTLHKQRVEFDRQQSLVSKASTRQPVKKIQTNQQPTNTVGDAIQDELFEQGAKFLFDQLF